MSHKLGIRKDAVNTFLRHRMKLSLFPIFCYFGSVFVVFQSVRKLPVTPFEVLKWILQYHPNSDSIFEHFGRHDKQKRFHNPLHLPQMIAQQVFDTFEFFEDCLFRFRIMFSNHRAILESESWTNPSRRFTLSETGTAGAGLFGGGGMISISTPSSSRRCFCRDRVPGLFIAFNIQRTLWKLRSTLRGC